MPKKSLNLSVEAASIERAQRYSQRHGVSISRLVDDFLGNLPVETESTQSLTAEVRSLIGIGAGEKERGFYRKHLLEKYGG